MNGESIKKSAKSAEKYSFEIADFYMDRKNLIFINFSPTLFSDYPAYLWSFR